MGEPSVFPGGETPRVFKQEGPSLFEIDSFLRSQPSDLLPSDLIEGLIQVLDDVDPIFILADTIFILACLICSLMINSI